MRKSIEQEIIRWNDALWPRTWNRAVRFFLTGMFTGTVISVALLAAWLIYSSL